VGNKEPRKSIKKKKKKNSSDKPKRLSDEFPPEEPTMQFGDEDAERRWSMESRASSVQILKKRPTIKKKRRKSKNL
jgi:hypothetical protein